MSLELQQLAKLDPVTADLFDHLPAIHAWLFGYLKIPSVSTDSQFLESMQQARSYVAQRLEAIGLENVQELDGGGAPAIFAEWCHAPACPTILIYGHYDVQPADPLEQWRSPPFEPTVVDGRIYARGASDVKAATTIALETVAGFLRVEGACPVNIKVLIEGEEEVGSPTLGHIIARYGPLLQVDAALSADGGRVSASHPSINVGARGNATAEIKIRTANKDLHSGRYGGAVRNALHEMARLISTLHHADGTVAVESFYHAVPALSAQDRAGIAALPFSEREFVQEVGASRFGEPGFSLREQVTMRPCLDINGMWGGYCGEGAKTIIPHEAHAKFSIRVVPGQDPAVVLEKVLKHLQLHLPEGADLEVVQHTIGAPASSLSSGHPLVLAAKQTLKARTRIDAVAVRLGASVPITNIFKEQLGIDTLMFGHNLPDEDVHAPNEFFRLQSIQEGLLDWTSMLRILAGFAPAQLRSEAIGL